ncbi:MAG: hypothetical protein ABSA12_10095 [Verrucomicrobiia bacterium]|jgi:hypothetical protein
MPRTNFLERLQRRLVDLGCPMAHVRRLVQEVADHREDLTQAALSEGFTESASEARAEAQLGNPVDLADRLAMALRQSSWWGRHFIIGFCLVPLLAVPVLWGLLVGLGCWLEFALGYGLDSNRLHMAGDRPESFHHIFLAVHCTDYIAIALVTLLFCWLARRSALGFKWMATSCVICSLYALFVRVTIVPHFFALGASSSPQWIRSAVPLVIAAAIYACRLRATRDFDESVAA